MNSWQGIGVRGRTYATYKTYETLPNYHLPTSPYQLIPATAGDGDFAATDTLVEISDDTFFGEIRGKCAEAGSVLDTAAEPPRRKARSVGRTYVRLRGK